MIKRRKGLSKLTYNKNFKKFNLVWLDIYPGDEDYISKIFKKLNNENEKVQNFAKHLIYQFNKYNNNNKSYYIVSGKESDMDILCEITKSISVQNESLLSYTSYLKSEFLDQLNLDRRPYDILLWTEEEVEQYLKDGINPYK